MDLNTVKINAKAVLDFALASPEFTKMYRDLFGSNKKIPLNEAISMLSVALEGRYVHIPLLQEFLAVCAAEYMSRDTWMQIPGFILSIDDDFGNYPEGSAFPVLLDDFVKFSRTRLGMKRKTGSYVGLRNQGSTCYLNSLLQTLYMIPEFRIYMYKWRMSADRDGAAEKCIPFQLQKLFARLQVGQTRAVSTKPLTCSFGWTSQSAFAQQDVQECWRLLFDALDRSYSQAFMTSMPIREMFQGMQCDYVQCLSCKISRSTSVPFQDISVGIQGVKTLEEALEKFCAVEFLYDDNQWHCPQCNRPRDAQKGLALQTLPYILTIHYKRFDYDYSMLQMRKLNHAVAFPFVLPMRTQDCDDTIPYELFAVLVHIGGAGLGHYFAYLKSFSTGLWAKFNDSVVTPVEPSEVSAASDTAYMVVYRREDISRNLRDVPGSALHADVIALVEKEDEEADRIAAADAAANANRDEGPAYGASSHDDGYDDWGYDNYSDNDDDQDQQEDDSVTLSIYYRADAASERVHKPIIIAGDKTVRDLLRVVCEMFAKQLEGVAIPDCVRLRAYRSMRDLPRAPLDDLTQQICDVRSESLLLEVRHPDEMTWEPYDAESQLIRVVALSADTQTLLPAMNISLHQDAPFGWLRDTIQARCSWLPSNQQRIIARPMSGDGQLRVLRADEVAVKSVLEDGETVYVEHAPMVESRSKLAVLLDAMRTVRQSEPMRFA